MGPKMIKPHISYSEFKDYCFCPHLHKLRWVDEAIPFDENEFLIFGTTIHKIAENQLKDQSNIKNVDWEKEFDQLFVKSLLEYKKNIPKEKELKKGLIVNMREQGKYLVSVLYPEMIKHYGEFETLSQEEALYEPIKNITTLHDINFKGFIDLVIRTKKDGKINIIDFKSSSAGWYGKDRSDKLKLYQLIFYKVYYSQKHNMPMDDINTSFILLKRTVKKDHIEVYPITSGEKRVGNAMELLEKTVRGIHTGRCWKNKYSCQKCYLLKNDQCEGVKNDSYQP